MVRRARPEPARKDQLVTRSSFSDVLSRVEDLIAAGESLPGAEAEIDAAPLPEDERAALWLVAWSLNDRRLESRTARELAFVGD
jgi:hypothetical protein